MDILIYNRVLDLTAVINIPIKLLAMYIIAKKTPKPHRYNSYFLLNIMCWNFIGNVFFAVVHIYPIYPSSCFKFDGPLGALIDNQLLAAGIMVAVLSCTMNCIVGLIFIFCYRYMGFVHPNLCSKLKPSFVFLFCGAFYLFVNVTNITFTMRTLATFSKLVRRIDPRDGRVLVCISNNGPSTVETVFGVIAFGMALMSTCTWLLYRKIRQCKGVIHPATLKLQMRVLRNIVVLTGIVLIFGAIPSCILLLCALFPEAAYVKTVSVVFTVILANYGCIYAIASLMIFKSYREAIRRMLMAILKNVNRQSRQLFVSRSTT